MENWILLFVKEMFIGSGFILPGVSDGALAPVFSIYDAYHFFSGTHYNRFLKECIVLYPGRTWRSNKRLFVIICRKFFPENL